MPRGKREAKPLDDKPLPTAMTPEARENQLIALAYDLAETRIREGTASAQEIVHFLKAGAAKERLEREILAEQKKLVVAKTGSFESARRVEELYGEAMAAFRSYSGNGSSDEEY